MANGRAIERLVSAVERDIESGMYHGVVMELRIDGESVYSAAIGETDKAKGRRASTDDIFIAMSLSKAFTAVALLQAIDRGAIQLDTRVAEIVPEFAVKGKQRATVLHLLTHQAGTFSGLTMPPPLVWGKDWGDLKKCVAAAAALPATHAPGERVAYSPWAGYAMLAEILERIDAKKRSFSAIVDDEVFRPLRMTDTRFGWPVSDPRRVPMVVTEPNATPGERALFESFNTILDESSVVPAGGAFTKLADVVRFIEMLRRGGELDGVRLLSPSLTRYALQNHTGDRPNGFWDFSREERGIDQFPARFTLLGGYTRGEGHYLSAMGLTASPGSYAAVGGGTTMTMFDPDRELSFSFLSAGFVEGLSHFRRLQRLSDLAIAAAD